MKNNKLYELADKEKLTIVNAYIDNCDGAFIKNDNLKFIVLNDKTIDSTSKLNCVLAEELGHYYMDATYSIHCKDKIEINRQEYRARKWAYTALIPLEKLKQCITEDFNIYETSEKLDVTPDFLLETIEYYKRKREL